MRSWLEKSETEAGEQRERRGVMAVLIDDIVLYREERGERSDRNSEVRS